MKKIFLGTAVAALIVTASCQKDAVQGTDSLNANGLAYTAVTETPTNKVINASVINGFTSFDAQQAWFDFTTVSTDPATKGRATNRTAWHLGFYSQTGNILVNGANSNLLAYLNYTVNTQGKQLTTITNINSRSLPAPAQTEIGNTVTNFFNGGTFGMGDLSTFDFHREGQFVIGTPPSTTTPKFYLIRTSDNVQIHPDSTAKTNLFVVSVRWNGSAYLVSYRALNTAGTDWAGDAITPPAIGKDGNYQSRFITFGSSTVNDNIQPQLSQWNLGLSAVVLKRYINPAAGGGAYPFALKGVVLNNNPAVKVYRVQSTGSTAGAPGPYDPNYSWQDDPALAPANDITTEFDNFNASNIDDSKFSGNSQEEIGQYYRYLDMGNYRVFVDRFYVIKLQNGDVYKLRFLPLNAGTNSSPVNNGIQIRYAKIATTP